MQTCKRQIAGSATIVLVGLIVMAGVFTSGGCGKKGLPEPPTGSRPPRVVNLAYSISGNTLELSWHVPATDPAARLPVTGFLIYRSQRSLSENACPNCPMLFKIIGDVPVREAGAGRDGKPAISFAETLDPGYRYIYKVHGYSKDGLRSKPSNVVEFSY